MGEGGGTPLSQDLKAPGFGWGWEGSRSGPGSRPLVFQGAEPMRGVPRLDRKCNCYMKNPQVDQMEVLAAPYFPMYPAAWEPRSQGRKGQENREQKIRLCRAARQRASLTFGSNGHELDPLAGYEIQGLVDVGDLVHSHLASLRLGQALPCMQIKREGREGRVLLPGSMAALVTYSPRSSEGPPGVTGRVDPASFLPLLRPQCLPPPN